MRWLLLIATIAGGFWSEASASASLDIPNSPAGKHLRWAIQAVQVGATIEPRDVFAAAFLDRISSEAIIESIAETSGETGGLELLDVKILSNFVLRAVLRARVDRSCWRIEIEVEQNEPHGITRILYDSDPALGVRYGDKWPRVAGLLEALPGDVAFAAYALRDTRLTPIYELNAEAVLAIGSTFKLWVLGALAERIADGEISWNDQLVIRDDLKSLPSGTMQNLPSGERRTLKEFAVKMISISDNTATDHLVHYLGRRTVESFAAAHGLSSARNHPLLTTREFFKLKHAASSSLRERYIAARPAERERLLVDSLTALPLPEASEPKKPVAIDQIEYFASAAQVAQALVRLDAMSQQPRLAPVWEALTQNPGIKWDRSSWPIVAYKGGSEPGVLYTAWLMERRDRQRFVMCFGVNDRTAVVDVDQCIKILEAAGELLIHAE